MKHPKIWLSSPHMGGREQDFVNKAFENNWVAPLGENVDGFENDLETFLGGNVHVAALSSGTAALHLALVLLGVKTGDEVICQSFTFSASANPILYQGATPVFIDSEKDSWNMCPTALCHCIIDRLSNGIKPKAIIVVHLYGMPADMDAIMAVAQEFDIKVIEDAAEALGSRYKDRACGTIGDFGVLSFNGNKIITTSGGGALVCKTPELKQKTIFLSNQSRDPAPHYQHSEIGYNYRMSNICAGIGRGQMEVLNARVLKRRENFEIYKTELEACPGLKLQEEPSGYFSNRWLTCLTIDAEVFGRDREQIRLMFEEQNIDSRPLWKPLHLQPIFAPYSSYITGVSGHLFSHGLCLPSGSNLEISDLKTVIETIKNKYN
jgi:dTDP-4-amino-4,6-dideoxygalactose transaminase